MKVVIPSKLSEGVDLVETIVAQASAHGFSEGACFAIRLSLDEALANAIRHGSDDDPSSQITVEYGLTDDVFEVSVCDKGSGFDPDGLPDPRLDENLSLPCGRGVMLMRAYMTKVTYNDRGNCVTMVKHKDCQRPQLG
jgi:serine/threonine-protein kinase RsbW